MVNLSISPSQLELIIKPGNSLTQAYQISNDSDQTVFLDSQVLPWVPTGTDGSVSYQDVTPNPHLYFSLNNSDLRLGQTFRLPANSNRQIVLKIKADPDTQPIDSYYTFFLSQNSSPGPDQDTSQARASIGSHLLISNSKQENPVPDAQIDNFLVSPKIIDSLLTPIKFTAQIQNLTPYFFKTIGSLTVSKNNQEIQVFDIFPNNVLANHSRDLACTLYFDQQKLPPQPAPCTLKPPFWPGRYTATLNLNLPLKTTSLTIYFYTFPYTATIALFSLITLFLLIKKFLIKKSPPGKHVPT